MKIFHIADLHLGKKLLKESLAEEQVYILGEILEAVRIEKPDVLVIAGDVYDKAVPSAEAVGLLDDFLCSLQELDLHVFLISGNHDSGDRLFYGKRIFEKSKIHIGAVFHGQMEVVTLKDEYGGVTFYMLPFVKPAMVQPFFETELNTYEDAIRQIVRGCKMDASKRNVLIAHQFVTWLGSEPVRSDSEQWSSLGGVDQVDAGNFENFDYVALGHIHKPQAMGRIHIRYSGSPLKYSFSEAGHQKSITCIELEQKGTTRVTTLPLQPRKELYCLKDTLKNLLSDKYKEYRDDCYLSITVTDEEKQLDPLGQLKARFAGILELHILRNMKESKKRGGLTAQELVKTGTMELFEQFYEKQNAVQMTETEKKVIKELLEKYPQEVEEEA